MNNEPKNPKFLYRGVVIGYNDLKEFKFFGVDLKPYKDPLIDSQGRKTVGDGNEYGLYMTDNQSMVYGAYGDVRNDGTPIKPSFEVGFPPTRISIPYIGVAYKISTENIDFRKPWIAKSLTGHYNNGFEGDEYITEVVPSGEYEVIRIKIATDFLHDSEEIDVSNIEAADKELRNKMEMRRYRLELLADTISKMTATKRSQIGESEKMVLKDIFGENGIRYVNQNSIDISSTSGVIKYLMTSYYNNSQNDIDFKNLTYLESIKSKLLKSNNEDNIDALVDIILEDIKVNLSNRASFIDRKKEAGAEIKTDAFDRKNQLYKDMLVQISKIRGNQSNHSNQNNPQIYSYFEPEEPMAR